MSKSSQFIVVIGCCGWLFIPMLTVRAADPEVTVKTDETWFKTIHTLTLNKEAADKLQETIDRVDPKLIGDSLSTAAKHPVVKILIALVTNNAEAFKKALNKEGAIGPNGITIKLSAYGGKLAKYTPILTTRSPIPGENRVVDAVQIVINPWSWMITPRD